MKSLCDSLGHPRIGVTIDTFHANIEEKSVSSAIEQLGPHLSHVHLSENDRGLLGSGHVDFAAIAAALRRVGYEGSLIIEGFGYTQTEQSSPGTLWADLTVTPDDIARDGISFLRTCLNN